MMIRAIIIDDEERSVSTLKALLKSSAKEVEVVAVAHNVEQGLAVLKSNECDVLFLDIEMPDGTGFDLLDKLGQINFDVCFITAFNQYAIKAFRYAALDYLMKPINPDELDNALSRVKQYNLSEGNARVELLLENRNPEAKFAKLAVATTEGVFYYNVDRLIRCEADGSYTTLFPSDEKPIVASKSIKEYESILPEFFLRVHKSHLVNVKHIKQFVTGEHPQLILKDNSSVSVSRRRKQLVAQKLSEFN